MIYSRLLFVLIAIVTLFVPAHADEVLRYNRVSLQATAEQGIVPDLMHLTLYSEMRDGDAGRLAQKTTLTLNTAIEKARQVAGMNIQSGSRNSYPVYDEKGKIIAWQERAELHLESDDFVALAALGADLAGELKIANQHFLVSKTLRRATENALIEEVITAFGERAQLITKSLGGTSYKIVQLAFDGQDGVRPLLAARNMEMTMAAPASAAETLSIEAGTHEVTISLQGLIEVE